LLFSANCEKVHPDHLELCQMKKNLILGKKSHKLTLMKKIINEFQRTLKKRENRMMKKIRQIKLLAYVQRSNIWMF